MKKIIVLLLLSFSITSIFSQEKVFEIDNAFLKPNSNRNETFALPDQKNEDLMLILAERKSVQGILMDSLYQEKARIKGEPLPAKYRHLLGYQIKENTYSILFTNYNESKFGVLQFNIKNKKVSEKKLDFKLKKELLIDGIVYNNEIYLFSITKRSSLLNIYKFDTSFNPQRHTLSLKEVEFPRIPGSSIISTVYSLLTRNNNSYSDYIQGVTKIESKNPNVIETTSEKIKIYQIDNKVIFSFDNNPSKTDLVYINLDTFKMLYKFYNKVSTERKVYKKNNSYLFDSKLFQIASSSKIMNFKIIDLETDTTIRDYTIEKEDSILFKNSSIIQEKIGIGSFGVKIDNTRELKKTSQFLKKISFANLGISVYKTNDLYSVVLGGTKEYNPTTGMAIAAGVIGGVPLGAGVVAVNPTPTFTHFNPTYYNYYSYSATKSIYINCLFDQDFEHVEGEIPLNKFDIINDFEDSLENPRAVNIFTHNNKLHYNFLNAKEGKLLLFKFEE
ncbi:hypothetical protein [Aquimarina sediminis]|uniref:hypothetical protein n=1 Tax=Aquimarina sediminis TaxID=2070536 RepID=UPI000CA04843|nr:hypothetical protein [Aquimarina sediminis]